MPKPVTFEEIENSAPQLLSVSTTASTLSATRQSRAKRTFFSIIPITDGVTVTVFLGDGTPSANKGIPLIKNQVFSMSLDANEKGVYQGTIQAIASGSGQVAFTELFER